MNRLKNQKMKFKNLVYIAVFSMVAHYNSYGQSQSREWNNKKCAVVLTYDDALNIHLDKVVPMLNSFKFKGTFYLIASSPAVSNRISEWRTAAKKGHELGNHTLNHPCEGNSPGREFVTPENNLSKYTVARAVNEIRITNTLLSAIDGKKERTFAYPCGDLTINDTLFYNDLKDDFVAARGITSKYEAIKNVDLTNIDAFFQVGSTAEKMITQVEEAEKNGSFIVFLFHGVGGEHALNVDLDEHRKLLEYLKKRKNDIWVAPMVEVAQFIKDKQAH